MSVGGDVTDGGDVPGSWTNLRLRPSSPPFPSLPSYPGHPFPRHPTEDEGRSEKPVL